MEKVISYIGWAGFIILTIAILQRMTEKQTIYMLPDRFGNKYASHGWDKGIEPFTNPSVKEPVGMPDKSLGNPADSSLNSPLTPYSLLGDSLALKNEKINLTAKTCYVADFKAKKEVVGNYNQMTNNFIHKTPDNCSAPLTEFVGSFYNLSK